MNRHYAGMLGISILIATSACSRVINFSQHECISTAPVVTQQRPASDITTITAANGFNVSYVQASDPAITVSAPSDLMDKIHTDISDKTLSIYSSKSLGSCDINIVVAAPVVNTFNINSGTQFTIDGAYSSTSDVTVNISSGAMFIASSPFSAPDIFLNSSSGSQIKFDGITFSDIYVSASSGSSVHLAGTGKEASLSASSGAGISAGDMSAASGSASASSGGSISSNITNCSVSTSSGGSVSNP